MTTYEYDENAGILKFHFVGKITIEDLFENAKEIRQHKNLSKDAKLLAYADKADFIFTPEELKQFGQHIATTERRFNSVKEAFIVARPKETAMTYIFGKSSLQMDHFKFKTFSTEEAALAWLGE